jgi:4'-phosphopantetheinyl transferase EntD
MFRTSLQSQSPASVNAARHIEALFAAGAVAFETHALLSADTLLPEEEPFVRRSAARRIHDFAGGRACARAALEQLGYGRIALPADANRAPCWPAGATGSISHTRGYCAAVVSRIEHSRALGLDVERAGSVGPHLWRRIFVPAELAALQAYDAPRAAEQATLMFSAKEAFYKCQHTLTGQWLGFSDIAVSVEEGRFRIAANRPLRISDLHEGPWTGRYRLEKELVITGVCIA